MDVQDENNLTLISIFLQFGIFAMSNVMCRNFSVILFPTPVNGTCLILRVAKILSS